MGTIIVILLALVGFFVIIRFIGKGFNKLGNWFEKKGNDFSQLSDSLYKSAIEEQENKKNLNKILKKMDTTMGEIKKDKSKEYMKKIRREIDELTG